MARKAKVSRKTKETNISAEVNIDGKINFNQDIDNLNLLETVYDVASRSVFTGK